MFGISCRQDILDIEPQDKIAESAVWVDPRSYKGVPCRAL